MLTIYGSAESHYTFSFTSPCVAFAFQIGLIELLKSFGITPDIVLGHSAGEVAAAYASGLLSLVDSVKVVYYRSKEQQKLEGSGRMLAVAMSRHQIKEYIDDMVSRWLTK